ncbi:hypothetical protein D3C77_513350 [compost metagenome]
MDISIRHLEVGESCFVLVVATNDPAFQVRENQSLDDGALVFTEKGEHLAIYRIYTRFIDQEHVAVIDGRLHAGALGVDNLQIPWVEPHVSDPIALEGQRSANLNVLIGMPRTSR